MQRQNKSKNSKEKFIDDEVLVEHRHKRSPTVICIRLITAIWSFLLVVSFTILSLSYLLTETLTFGYKTPSLNKLMKLYLPLPLRIVTVEELKQHGPGAERIYLSIMGEVFDVTAGKAYYGKQGSYKFFSGTDASRAYATGCFDDHLTHDLRGLSKDQIDAIKGWRDFFMEHDEYIYIGKLELPSLEGIPIPKDCKEQSNK